MPSEESTRDGFGAADRDGAVGKGLGWWDGMIGPGKAFDTDRFFVICTNLLGGCGGTTGPSSIDPATGRPYGADFPVITVADMVRTQRAFLDVLGIERLAAVAGGSLGGMQAMEWAVMYPDQVDAVVAIASTHALHPQGMAWNAIARDSIMRDPAWQGGHYYGTGRAPDGGMGVARMVGHITYLSAPALGDKFGRAAAVRRRPPLHDHRAGVRGGELPAPPGWLVRQALRRQHLPLRLARADVLRPRAAARRRIADAGARRRRRADAADRLQLRLALPAEGVGGGRAGAARPRQAGRVRGDRGTVRPRLLPARRSAPDSHDPPVPGSGRDRMTSKKRPS
ncbi:alpha/beta fold hydrolase [Nonomuraea ferruginea]